MSQDDFETHLRGIQRDVNCLTDPNRVQRRRALQRLRTFVESNSKADHFPRVLSEVLLPALAKRVSDDSEQCRELTLDLLLFIVSSLCAAPTGGAGAVDEFMDSNMSLEDLMADEPSAVEPETKTSVPVEVDARLKALFASMLQAVVGVCAERLGRTQSQSVEPSEEVRLKMVQLVHQLMDLVHEAAIPSLDDLVSVSCSGVRDAFPALKQEAAECARSIGTMCESADESVLLSSARNDYFSKLSQALVPALRHQRSRVRQSALEGLSSLVLCQCRRGVLESAAAQQQQQQLAQLAGRGAVAAKTPQKWTEEVFRGVRGLVFDRSATVRLSVVRNVGGWLEAYLQADNQPKQQAPSSDETQPPHWVARMALLLLGSMTDGQNDVREAALEAVQRAAVLAVATPTVAASSSSTEPAWIPAPFLSSLPHRARPSAEARKWVSVLLPKLLDPTIKDLRDWTERTRARAVGTLQAISVYGESALSPYLDQILPVLYRGVADDSKDVYEPLLQLARILGWVTDSAVWLGIVVPTLSGGQTDANYLSNVLLVVTSLVEGLTAKALQAQFGVIVSVVGHFVLCAHESSVVRLQALRLFQALLRRTDAPVSLEPVYTGDVVIRGKARLHSKKKRKKPKGQQADEKGAAPADDSEAKELEMRQRLGFSSAGRILWALHQIDAFSSQRSVILAATSASGGAGLEASLSAEAQKTMEQLAQRCQTSVEELYASHFVDFFVVITGGYSTLATIDWHQDSLARHLFVRLLQRGAKATGEHLHVIVPVLTASADVERDAPVRMDALRMLHSLASASPNAWREWMPHVLKHFIVPNAVWRAGRANAKIRLQAIRCLQMLCACGVLSDAALAPVFPHLNPVLASSLDDDEAEVRLAVSGIYRYIFSVTSPPPHSATENPVVDLYQQLIKRLDDSNDSIRKDIAETFTVFARRWWSAEVDATGTHFQYIVKTFLVHLDDPTKDVQDAMYRFLETFTAASPQKMAELVTEVKGKHRSPEYCDRLLSLAAQHEQKT